MTNKKILAASTAIVIVAIALPAAFFSMPLLAGQEQQQELDFTVTGKNECLRFLEKNVSVGYIPFRTGANERWQLTITCSEMPSPNAVTDLYIYRGYWNDGSDYKCLSEDLYPIISDIETTEYKIKANSTFTETFGESTPQSYTILFLFPTGGQGTFHIKLDKAN